MSALYVWVLLMSRSDLPRGVQTEFVMVYDSAAACEAAADRSTAYQSMTGRYTWYCQKESVHHD